MYIYINSTIKHHNVEGLTWLQPDSVSLLEPSTDTVVERAHPAVLLIPQCWVSGQGHFHPTGVSEHLPAHTVSVGGHPHLGVRGAGLTQEATLWLQLVYVQGMSGGGYRGKHLGLQREVERGWVLPQWSTEVELLVDKCVD